MFPDYGINVMVEDTGHRLIQGHNLKYLAVTYPNNNGFDFHDTIYERIGYAGFMYPFDMQLNTDPDVHDFCNYSDNAFADWNHPDSMCMLLPTGIFQPAKSKPLSISPNPSDGNVRVAELPESERLTFQVFNSVGQLILTKPLQVAMDLRELTNGIYFVTVKSRTDVYRSKLIISK